MIANEIFAIFLIKNLKQHNKHYFSKVKHKLAIYSIYNILKPNLYL